MKILISGGAGFVGSKIAVHLSAANQMTVLDNLTRRGGELNLPILREHGITFIHGDIRNPEDLSDVPPVDLIIDASADPSVLSGIHSSATKLISTNLLGTVNILEKASEWQAKFIFLSTSRVYSIPQLNRISFTEGQTRFEVATNHGIEGISSRGISESFSTSEYRSFYGSAKLASELIIQEYAQYKGVSSIINRSGVIAGPGQFGKVDQGILVHWLISHLWKRKLTYFGFGGTGKQVRDFLHILDLVDLIEFQIQNFDRFSNRTLNVGGGMANSLSLKELTQLCQDITGNTLSVGADPKDRVADIPYYVTDNSLINDLGWHPIRNNQDLIKDTYAWIIENEQLLKNIL